MASSSTGAPASTPANGAAASAGTVLTSTAAAAARRASVAGSSVVHSAPTPRATASASSRAALSWLRAATTTWSIPSVASPTSAAGAVPPAPSTRADPVSGPPNAPATPSTSVLSARQPDSVRSRVFAEPTNSARSVRSEA